MAGKIILFLSALLKWLERKERNYQARKKDGLAKKIRLTKQEIYSLEAIGSPGSRHDLRLLRLRLHELENELADLPTGNTPTD